MQYTFSNIGIEPITLAEVKAWLKVDYDDEDAIIALLIQSVRQKAELFTGISLIIKTVTVFYQLDEVLEEDERGRLIPGDIALPFPEHDTITSVELNGSVTTDYTTTGLTQKIIKLNTAPIPVTQIDNEGLKVVFTTTGSCHEEVKTAMKKCIAELYEHRKNTGEESADLTENTYAALAPYQIWR